MKRSLSVFLSLVLLVSSLVIPMSVSAAAEINSETLISGIKTAAANLQYKESTKQQFLVPLGVHAVKNSSHSKTLSAEDTSGYTEDEKSMVGSKVIKLPTDGYATDKNWNWGTTGDTDAIVSYQPVYNKTDPGSTGLSVSPDKLKNIYFSVKTSKPLTVNFKFHSGNGFNTSNSITISETDKWKEYKLDVKTQVQGTESKIAGTFLVVNDDSGTQGLNTNDEVLFGSLFVETWEDDVIAVNNITGTDISTLEDCIVAAENIDTSFYTAETVDNLKTAITNAKTALISYCVDTDKVTDLTDFVNKEISVLSKTEILLIGKFARLYNSGSLASVSGAITLSPDIAKPNGYVSEHFYPSVDGNWRYMSKNFGAMCYVAPGVTKFGDIDPSTYSGFKAGDYDDIYLYIADNIETGSSDFRSMLKQFGALQGTQSWVGNSTNSTNAILSALESNGLHRTPALKTKISIKSKGTYTADTTYSDTSIIKGFQFFNENGWSDNSEIGLSPIYGVNYCKTTVTNLATIADIYTYVNSNIDVNAWDNGSILDETVKAIKENLIEDLTNNLNDKFDTLRKILVSELSDAKIIEEVWIPKWLKDSSAGAPVTYPGDNVYYPYTDNNSITDNNILDNKEKFGSCVAKLDNTHFILSITRPDATNAYGDDCTPVDVNDYADMWMYVYNDTENTIQPDQFIVVSTNSDSVDYKISLPPQGLTRIDVYSILETVNEKKKGDSNWNTNRIQIYLKNLAEGANVYVGSVFGLKKLVTSTLETAKDYKDIFAFYDQKVRGKGWENADDAESTFKAIRTSIATSENVDDIKDLLLYELGNVGTVEEIWRPKWSAKRNSDNTDWAWGSADNAIDTLPNEVDKNNFGEFAVKLDSTYQITSVTDAGAPNQQPNAGPFLNVDDYFDIWMYAYNTYTSSLSSNEFMVVSTKSKPSFFGGTCRTLQSGLNRIKLYDNLVAANAYKNANPDKDENENVVPWNMVRLQIQYNAAENIIPEGAAVYYGSVLGIKRIDTSELQTAKRMVDIIEFYDKYIAGKSLVYANGESTTEIADFVNFIKGDFISINATLNDDTFVTPTADCPYTLKYAKLGAEFKFKVDVKNGGSVTSVTYGGETVTVVDGVYTITVDADKELKITTDRDAYATVNNVLTVDSGATRVIIDHSTANNHPTWSQNKDTLNGGTETVVYQEPVLFYTDGGKVRENVKLMYPVNNIVAVTSYTTIDGEFVKYYKDKDFTITDDGKITLTEKTAIPTNFELNEMKTGIPDREGKVSIWNGAGKWENELPKNQVLVTYTYTKTWGDVDYEMPTYVNNLTTAYDELKNNNTLDVLFIGDSITTGCNASGQDGKFYTYTENGVGETREIKGWSKYLDLSSQPNWVNDSWDKQVVANLKKAYPDATIDSTNRAVGSSNSQWYLNNIETLLSAEGPTGSDSLSLQDTDLVFIGFGMNEHSDTKQTHINKIKNIINYLRQKNPNVSIVLVSAFYPTFWKNEEWTNYKLGEYEDAYFELAKKSENIAVAPVNTAFANILKAKEGVDYIANGINHPNDYGVNLYANVITSTLVGSANIDAPYAMYLYNRDGKATYDDGGTEKTAVYLFAQYQSPVVDGNVDPTQIILSDGTVGTVQSRTIYLATKANAEKLGDDFGKVTSNKVKSSTVSGNDLKKCWANEVITDSSNKLVTYGVKASGIIKANKDKPLAVRAKIVYTVGTDKYTIYTDVQTSEHFSAQGAYGRLYGQGTTLGWFND